MRVWQRDSMHNAPTLKLKHLSGVQPSFSFLIVLQTFLLWHVKMPEKGLFLTGKIKQVTSVSYKHTALWTSLYGLCLVSLWATWGPCVQPFPVGLVIWWPGNCVVSSLWDSYPEAFHSCHTLCCCSSLLLTSLDGWTNRLLCRLYILSGWVLLCCCR